MARARNIKPSFFDNDTLALNNDPLGRLLFIGLWTLADCNGNLEWRAHRIKVKVLPYDECDVERLAINLDKSGFIRFYSDGENILVNITNFTLHQNPHKNERDKGGAVAEYSDEGRQLIDLEGLTINRDLSGSHPEANGSDPADSLLLNPDSPSLNPDSGILKDEGPPPGKPDGEGADKQRRRTPKAKLTKSDLINDFELSESLAVQFLQIRKDKRLTLTPKAMDDLVNEFGKAGLSVETGIELCCRKSWAAFKASWDWQGGGSGRSGQPFKETPQQRGERMARERGIIQ